MSLHHPYDTNPLKRKSDDLYLNATHGDYTYNQEEHPSKRRATEATAVNVNFGYDSMFQSDDVQKQKSTTSNNQQQAHQQIPVQHLDFSKPKVTPPLYNLRQYQVPAVSTPSPSTQQVNSNSNSNTPRREITLHYVNEIANFGHEDVKLAMSCRIDDETGELYGPIGDINCGHMFGTFSELIGSGVHKSNANSPLISYHEEEVTVDHQRVYNIKPAASVLVYDTDDHDDRGNIILFSSPYKVQIPNTNTSTTPLADRGNKALVKNIQGKIAVRVVRGRDNLNVPSKPNRWVPQNGYRYDGLYFVADYWYEKYSSNESTTTWSFIFKLVRIYGQPSLPAYNSAIMTQQHVVHQPRIAPTNETYPYNTGLVDNNNNNRQSSYGPPATTRNSYQSTPNHNSALPTVPLSNSVTPPAPSPSNNRTQQSNSISHNTIKNMLQDLRSKNSQFEHRMEQYSKNIRELNKKHSTTDFSSDQDSKRIVTSRNKDFFWKLNGSPEPVNFAATQPDANHSRNKSRSLPSNDAQQQQ